MKYNKGDKVVIVSERIEGMNKSGHMDCYLGSTMTIKSELFSSYYKMEEDEGVWFWYENMIDHQATFEMGSNNIARGV